MHTEGVPNPNAMKFVLENGNLVDQPYEFRSYSEATNAPLAKKLLLLRYVDRVLMNRNFITVVKTIKDSPAWDKILFELKMMIEQHLEANEPILYIGVDPILHVRSDEVVVELVRNMLDQHIRPAAQEDGGDILFESFKDGVLNLSMHGSCHLCPYANQTVKEGVEKLLTNMIPEVKKVTAVENMIV